MIKWIGIGIFITLVSGGLLAAKHLNRALDKAEQERSEAHTAFLTCNAQVNRQNQQIAREAEYSAAQKARYNELMENYDHERFERASLADELRREVHRKLAVSDCAAEPLPVAGLLNNAIAAANLRDGSDVPLRRSADPTD